MVSVPPVWMKPAGVDEIAEGDGAGGLLDGAIIAERSPAVKMPPRSWEGSRPRKWEPGLSEHRRNRVIANDQCLAGIKVSDQESCHRLRLYCRRSCRRDAEVSAAEIGLSEVSGGKGNWKGR